MAENKNTQVVAQQKPVKVGITGYLSNEKVKEQIVNVVGEKTLHALFLLSYRRYKLMQTYKNVQMQVSFRRRF